MPKIKNQTGSAEIKNYFKIKLDFLLSMYIIKISTGFKRNITDTTKEQRGR